jgi:hypothetical protein
MCAIFVLRRASELILLTRKPKDGSSDDSRVEVSKDDISSLTWATVGKSQQFRVHRFDGVEERSNCILFCVHVHI